ncbi:histone-lysine N-methyltransferase SETMAR-like [Haliotis rufescens]|uniref:histone-lysine N-methyltransferase SETMAR-like n=1 Tax=Haliotis rufescens TaxID=6454 RepID=UPI00201F284A|nr:histone-lysine N-methyltransferase SETMAR-like [Haliotis rufescens]
MVNVYSEDAPQYSTVAKWAAEFNRGRTILEDDPRSGRPADVITDEIVAKVQNIITTDRRIKVDEIASECGISHGSVCNIIHERLHMSKVSARWVPRNLNAQDRHQRVVSSRELLDIYRADPENFHARLVTGDETWIHHWDPETKKDSKQWKNKTSPPPKKFKTQPSAGKIMATVFWDSKGVLMIDYKPPKKTKITGAYWADLMKKLRNAIKEKRRGMLTAGVLLLHDNAPAHKRRVAQAAIRECKFEQLNQPPYSPDLEPSNYYLFRHLKSHLRGTRFANDDDLIAATEAWFGGQGEDFYFQGIESLQHKWEKCIQVHGDYIEK